MASTNKKNSEITVGETGWMDHLKWALVVILLVAGIWANYYYSQIDWPLRLAGWIVLACVALVLAQQTVAGQKVWQFAKSARAELRKVTWPTRQETMQTTLLIVGMVVLMAVILWSIDSLLLWIVSGLNMFA